MGPGIGRSIKEGFAAASRSWAGIGVFAGGWVVTIVVAIIVVALTKPPAALFQQERPMAEEAVVPAPASSAATPPATSPASSQADLFKQLSKSEEASPAPQPEVAAQPQTTTKPQVPDPAAARRREIAERDRLAGEWFGKSWPILLLCLLVVMAANLWLNGGQIGYLAKQVTTRHATLAEFWGAGTKAFGAMVGGMLLSFAGLAGVMLVGVLLATILAAVGRATPGWVGTLIAVVGVVLALCGAAALMWLLVRLSFWFIAIVAERLGPIAALKRSVRVTKGHWWQIAGLGLLMALISYGVWLPFGLLEWLGKQMGGAAASTLGILGNLFGFVASLFVGFAMLAAYIRFYEDAKNGPVSGTP